MGGMVHGILVGDDGSPGSEKALFWAAREARARGAVLTVCQALLSARATLRPAGCPDARPAGAGGIAWRVHPRQPAATSRYDTATEGPCGGDLCHRPAVGFAARMEARYGPQKGRPGKARKGRREQASPSSWS